MMLYFDLRVQEYYHNGIALRASGGIDFYFNFRLVESKEADPEKLTFTEINGDFLRLVFKVWNAEKQKLISYTCPNDWKQRIGLGTSF